MTELIDDNMHDVVKLTWQDIDNIHRQLVSKIVSSGFAPDICIGILRGSLVTLCHFSYLLDIKEVRTIGIRTGDSEGQLAHIKSEPIVYFDKGMEVITNNKVLLVDGAIGTGKTLSCAIDSVMKYNPSELKVAIVSDWLGSPTRPTQDSFRGIQVYIGSEFVKWPEFPWEV